MMLPYDSILLPIVVIAVFIYGAYKGKGESKKSHDDKSVYDIFREIGKQSSEYKRDQERLRDGY